MSVTGTRSRWRPPEGRSRLATGLRRAGWVLLGIGVLLAGFVAYELFVTSFFANRAQDGLTEALDDRIATAELETVAYEQGSLELIAVPLGIADDVPLPAPSLVAAAQESSRGFAALRTAASGSGGVSPGEEMPAGSIVEEPPAIDGDALGRIEIPSIGLDWTVVEGVEAADLRRGAGHMPDTAMPGQPGNAVISGHRTTYGAPFHNLGDTETGNLITVTTATGSHVYQIVEIRVVQPTETWVTGQWEGSWLTLTTCHPKYSARQRLVVVARLVGGPNVATLGSSA